MPPAPKPSIGVMPTQTDIQTGLHRHQDDHDMAFPDKPDARPRQISAAQEVLAWQSQLATFRRERGKQKAAMKDTQAVVDKQMKVAGAAVFIGLMSICWTSWFIDLYFAAAWACVYFAWAVFFISYPATAHHHSSKPDTPSQARHTACLIACHRSVRKNKGLFELVLRTAAARFGGDNVFVCDNSNDEAPSPLDIDPDTGIDTRRLCEKLGVHYTFVSEGNKSLALLWVARSFLPMVEGADRFKQILIMDDDVLVPRELPVPELEGDEVACSYPIRAITSDIVDEHIAGVGGADSFVFAGRATVNTFAQASWSERTLTQLQDFEYAQLNATLYAQYALGGSTLYGCGAMSLWKREMLIEKVLGHHTSMFDGEDVRSGLLVQTHGHPYTIRFEPSVAVPTSTPVHMFTRPDDSWSREKSLWAQRVHSWEHLTHRFLPLYTHHLLHYWHSVYHIPKLFVLREVVAVLADYAAMPLLLCALATCSFTECLEYALFCYSVGLVTSLQFQFWTMRARPDMQAPGWGMLLLYPLYDVGMRFVFRSAALLRNLFAGGVATKPDDVVMRLRYADGSFPPPTHSAGVPSLNVRELAGDWSQLWCLMPQVGSKQ